MEPRQFIISLILGVVFFAIIIRLVGAENGVKQLGCNR